MPDLYELAKGIGYLFVDEVDEIVRIAKQLPANAICANIGSGAGTSVLAVLLNRDDVMLYDIDITPDNGVAQMREFGKDDPRYWRRLTGDSKSIAYDGPPLDYLFVDGDHSDAGLRGDLAAWLPRCNPDAWVLIHDYSRDVWPDVARVTDEVMGDTGYTVNTLRVFKLGQV
jgi:hypothetical protein